MSTKQPPALEGHASKRDRSRHFDVARFQAPPPSTLRAPERLVRRLLAHSAEPPWRWTAAHVGCTSPSRAASWRLASTSAIKHPLALVEGSTENATLTTDLLVGLRDRGLDMTRPILVVLDGSSALRRAVVDVFDHPIIARCQLPKIRNVQDKLPQHLREPVGTKMRTAYHADSALLAEAQLQALARELDKTHPRVAASLREGLAETLTVLRLGVPPTLARTLRSTNAIESMIGVCRQRSANVKRWRDGDLAMRWCAAGMVEAGKQFRRVNGHLHLASLRAALEREAAETVGAAGHDDLVSVA